MCRHRSAEYVVLPVKGLQVSFGGLSTRCPSRTALRCIAGKETRVQRAAGPGQLPEGAAPDGCGRPPKRCVAAGRACAAPRFFPGMPYQAGDERMCLIAVPSSHVAAGHAYAAPGTPWPDFAGGHSSMCRLLCHANAVPLLAAHVLPRVSIQYHFSG